MTTEPDLLFDAHTAQSNARTATLAACAEAMSKARVDLPPAVSHRPTHSRTNLRRYQKRMTLFLFARSCRWPVESRAIGCLVGDFDLRRVP